MSRIGDRIKEERLKKGFSPKQLARKCGIGESYILDIESGKKIINEIQLNQLSKILGKNLDEDISLEPEEKKEVIKKSEKIEVSQIRKTVTPLSQWEDALSNIIKKVPIYDMEMKQIKGHKAFPIIDKKVDGFHPEKLIYVEIPNENLSGFRICKGDKIFIYLNQELVNNSFSLIEYEGKKKVMKVKRIEGNKVELISYHHEMKSITKSIKDVKIIGRGLCVEMALKH
ncbi:helix-turn-helix domain-containing protein [Marinisporobacter balticus]|uniref:Helix-turn-helix protein n=1 Tax=Marinisporobacter balticus TaxID=2018667 RepID=A0A4R2KMU1_9FIRM|nr:helix-turn-helix domain-containing protein [Marinisporobacter balticus]TCO71388.1 helix-turn-helix protein [Marinisporobacter balticus]